MPRKVDPRALKRAVKAILNSANLAEAARKLGIPRSTLVTRLNIARKQGLITQDDIGDKARDAKKWEIDNKEDTNITIWSVDDRVKTVEDALNKAQIDPEIWEVERSVLNSWEVAMKGKFNEDGTPKHKTVTLWQVKVWLRRKVPKIYTDAADLLIKRMEKYSPKHVKISRAKKIDDPHMLEISIFDHHFGKLAWHMETGENYDLKIAEKLYRHAVEDLTKVTRGFNIEKILMPVGQDFFHIDNPSNTTVNGTSQDVDCRYTKLFDSGVISCINAIEFVREIAPVTVLYVPGNHDRTAAWHLVSEINTWYRLDKEVTVDKTPTTRKYERYGCNLIGFTHGDEEPHSTLPTLMASEVPDDWAATKCREWHLGHFHKKKKMVHTTGDTYGPVHVRILPSMSATDAWHYRKGYTGGTRSAEAYLWSRERGYTGHFNAYARE